MSWNIFKKKNQADANRDIEIAIEILRSVKENITEDSDFLWTSYKNAEELNLEISSIILRLEQQDLKAISDVYVHFLPTSTFQEHSLMNDWADNNIKLADRFDKIYERNKNNR